MSHDAKEKKMKDIHPEDHKGGYSEGKLRSGGKAEGCIGNDLKRVPAGSWQAELSVSKDEQT